MLRQNCRADEQRENNPYPLRHCRFMKFATFFANSRKRIEMYAFPSPNTPILISNQHSIYRLNVN